MKTKDKKRLMIVVWNMGVGGIQKRLRDLILDIVKNHDDWEVYLLIKYGTVSKDYILKDLIDRRQDNFKYDYYSDDYKKSKTIKVIFWIAKRYLCYKPNVCLTFLDYLSAIMVGIKKILFWHKVKLVLNEGILTSDYLKIHRKKVWFWRNVVKIAYRFANLIIVPSQACKKDLVTNFKIPSKKIVKIPNWTLYKPEKPLKKVYDLIFIGRLEKEKDPLLLVKIVKDITKKLPKVKLCIIGEGRLAKSLRTAIKAQNLNKNIVMLNTKKEIVPYLRRSKILILPTVNEGMPNIVLEAGICSIPAITTKFPGVEEVINDGHTGLIAKSGKGMVELTKKLLKNNSLRRKLGRNARKYVQKNFSYNNQKKFISILLS